MKLTTIFSLLLLTGSAHAQYNTLSEPYRSQVIQLWKITYATNSFDLFNESAKEVFKGPLSTQGKFMLSADAGWWHFQEARYAEAIRYCKKLLDFESEFGPIPDEDMRAYNGERRRACMVIAQCLEIQGDIAGALPYAELSLKYHPYCGDMALATAESKSLVQRLREKLNK